MAISTQQQWTAEGDLAEDITSRPPRHFNVILLNDDYTTMEFVVQILTSIFHHTPAEAMEIMLNVHKQGCGVAGTYSKEVAETKAAQTVSQARENGFPLECRIEPA